MMYAWPVQEGSAVIMPPANVGVPIRMTAVSMAKYAVRAFAVPVFLVLRTLCALWARSAPRGFVGRAIRMRTVKMG